jgi:hypothetical protein
MLYDLIGPIVSLGMEKYPHPMADAATAEKQIAHNLPVVFQYIPFASGTEGPVSRRLLPPSFTQALSLLHQAGGDVGVQSLQGPGIYCLLRAHDYFVQPPVGLGETVQAEEVFTSIRAETNLLESLDFPSVLGQVSEKASDPPFSSPGAEMVQQAMPYRWDLIGG